MSLKLKNDWKYVGDDRWDWSLYLDSDDPAEIQEVESVKYILHPTFKSPIRTVSDPSEGFRLNTNGWGSFDTKAFVYLKDGKKIKLMHELQLSHDPKTGTSS
jgi:transcription initiation factor IIF auxiliary subunit